jgi:DNA topoisomerase-3
MSKLVIAEKPSVAREIGRILGARSRRKGYLEGNEYLVSWAVGHVCNIAPPDKQNANWGGRWNYAHLPMIPKKFKLEVNKKTKDQYQVLKKLLTLPEVTEVISATDAGREVELIFRRIYAHSRSGKPVKRLWLSSMTDEAISSAFSDLKDAGLYDSLGAAAYARAEADWLVGMNGTRAFTLKAGELLTCGRVQTPVLALLVARRQEIDNFKPQPYWELVATIYGDDMVKSFKAIWHEPPKLKERKITEEAKAFEILNKCQGHSARVESSKLRKGSTRVYKQVCNWLSYDLSSRRLRWPGRRAKQIPS